MSRKYQLIALDMDGTVLNDKKEIDEETIEFIIESIVRYEKINIAIDKNYDEIEAYDIH